MSKNDINKGVFSAREKNARLRVLRDVVADLRLSKAYRQEALSEVRILEEALGLPSHNYNGAD